MRGGTASRLLTNYDVIRLLKVRYYYLEVKMTAARDGKRAAFDIALADLHQYVTQAKSWVESQPQVMTNFERTEFEVELISTYGARLLKLFVSFDEVMSALAAAQFAGGQSDQLRVNYFHGFNTRITSLVGIATKSEPHFHISGAQRQLAVA